MTDVMVEKEEITVEQVQERSIFKEKNFLFLWVASVFSSLSVSFFLFSQSWYVVEVLELKASLGLIFIAASVPRLLFMALGGVIADRMSRSMIMFISDMSRAILLIGLVAMLVFDLVSLWTFVGFAIVFGILDAFFWPASGSLLPSLVPKSQLTRANSVVQSTNQLSMIAGPMLAGFIIHWQGYSVVFSITAVLLLLAGILVFLIKSAPARNGQDEEQQTMLQSIMEGVRYIKASTFLATLMLASVFLNLFVVGPLVMGLPIFVKDVLDGDTLQFSFLEGALAGGMLMGAVIVGVLNIEKKRGRFAMIGIGIMAVFYLLLSQVSMFWQSIVVLFLIGASLAATNIPIMAVIQSIVEKEMIGRVMSLINISSMGLIPVSYALTSLFLAMGFSISVIMLMGAVPLLVMILYIFLRVPVIFSID